MRVFFTTIALSMISIGLLAQKNISHPQSIDNIRATSILAQHNNELNNRFDVEPDTIFPDIFGTDDCSMSDNWTVYGSQDDDGNVAGYLTGNNAFIDLEKGELLGVAGVPTISVNAVYMVPIVGINLEDSEVSAKIYAFNPDTNLPGDLLGTSESIKVEELNNVGDNFFNFSPAIEVTGDKFFAVIDFIDSYDGATGALKDTIGIVSTSIGCGSETSSVEKWSDGTWHVVKDAWSLDGGINMIVGAAVEYDDESTGFVTPGKNGVELMPAFPNPAQNKITMAFSLADGSDAMFRVVDALGREVISQNLGYRQEGNHLHDLDIATLSSGIYFYSLHTNKAILSGSFNKK